ncbi:MAG: PIN domain-containing protein [Dehalococcoidia bacterium]|nr:PIN domain-containing protein [Dehalococcoidia bacterium]
MEEVFVDASAWVTLADKDDVHHKEAATIYPELLKRYGRLVTTNLVVGEVYMILRRALGLPQAISFLDGIKASPRIVKLCSTEELEEEAEVILRHYSDQDFSFTDAVSFSLMAQRKIRLAFAFDRHFAAAGFALTPNPI